MSNNIFYNTSYFKFFKRHIKPKEMEKELISLIYSKKSNNSPKTDRNNYNKEKEKNLNLDVYFQKHSIILINKIRDLFREFDVDKSNSFDQNEFYQMFNINKIPIKMEEIIYLFNFNKQKKAITFSELIKLTFDSDFDKRYKIIISKVKSRCEKGIICPNDFSGMLSHLCEFGKLSSDAKNFRKELLRSKRKSTLKHITITESNRQYIRSKTKDEIKIEKKESNKHMSEDKIKRQSSKKFDENNKKISNSRNRTNLTEMNSDYQVLEKSHKMKEEHDNMINYIKTIIEITKKKIVRNEQVFKNLNYRNKIENSKRNLAKSIDILHKINPKINNTYISYCPINQKFIDLNTGKGYDFSNIKDYKYKGLKNNIKENENILNYKPIITEANENDKRNNHKIFLKQYLLNKKDKKYYRNKSNNVRKKDSIFINEN